MLKATSKYGKTFANLDLTSNFDPDFEQINVTMSSNATGFHSHGNLQVRAVHSLLFHWSLTVKRVMVLHMSANEMSHNTFPSEKLWS